MTPISLKDFRTMGSAASLMIQAFLLSITPACPAGESLSLKESFKDYFPVGAAVNRSHVTGHGVGRRNFKQVGPEIALVKAQFNQITAENDMKWAHIHPREGADGYDFGPADAFVEFGEQTGLQLVGHTLVWHNQTPDWVFAGAIPPPEPAVFSVRNETGYFRPVYAGPRASREELLGRMRDHIHSVVGRYKGRVKTWDVVNEALADGPPENHLRDSLWLQIIGPDYIAKAFQFAHEADPDAILRYNDFGLEDPVKVRKLVTLIKSLQQQKVPIHAIGTQAHLNLKSARFERVDPSLAEIAKLGLPIHVTELDIHGGNHGETQLARAYEEVFRAIMKHRKSVKMVTFWGVNDAVSWLRDGSPLLFDGDCKPKPAFDAVIRVADDTEPSTHTGSVSIDNGWVTVAPPEFPGAINNPLKGFRKYKEHGYGLLERTYIKWRDIEVGEGDSVERIIAHTNKITNTKGRRFEDLNIKLVPRVFLDWNGEMGSKKGTQQHWPADLHTFDYESPAFQQRLRALVAKLGQAWDEDPRIFAVQMGLIGRFGEHHNPAPTAAQRRLLTEAFQKAFKNKPVLVRHNDPEFMEAGFGIYYDTFANVSREPPDGPENQFPWQATHVYRDIWKRAPIEGEVEYNWQMQRKDARPEETFGRTPDETMTVPEYRRYMIDKIRRYHASYLGWINNYDDANREVLAGAGEIQKAFGYRFVLDSASYPLTLQPGAKLPVKLTVRNTGSAPFYLDWPVAVVLLDPATAKPVWSAPLSGVDIRKWLPGEDWDSEAFTYRRPAGTHHDAGEATLPDNLEKGQYIIALAILDRQGGMMPSARFATSNYFRGGWHPLGFIGIGETPKQADLKHAKFDSPAFDNSLHYIVPDTLRAVTAPPIPQVKPVMPWTSDPKVELINPWRYWTLNHGGKNLEKQILAEDHRVIRVTGDYGKNSSLNYAFGNGIKLDRGRYRFTFRVRGTPGQSVGFELADDWRGVSKEAEVPLTETWQEHRLEFEIKTKFKDETTLRFNLPRDAKGTFDLAETRLKRTD